MSAMWDGQPRALCRASVGWAHCAAQPMPQQRSEFQGTMLHSPCHCCAVSFRALGAGLSKNYSICRLPRAIQALKLAGMANASLWSMLQVSERGGHACLGRNLKTNIVDIVDTVRFVDVKCMRKKNSRNRRQHYPETPTLYANNQEPNCQHELEAEMTFWGN